MSKKTSIGLTERIPEMVGRQEELIRLQRYLKARGDRHFVYYWAGGGLGKTRLLEELQRLVKEAGPGYHSTGIIDLYHTDTHGTSDVERAIIDGLDPERKYFAAYREERGRYELLRERGTDPGVLEQRREKLSRLFVEGCREMALDVRKLVICFDTVELLQYESSIVEEMAGLETVDTRIKPWLLEKLAKLANVLVVFAGRPKLPAPGERVDPQKRLVEDLEQAFGQDLAVVELQPLTLDEAETFIQTLSGGQEVIPSKSLPVVHRLTGGRPIFLHLIVDLIQVLALEPRTVLEMFDQHTDLVKATEDDPRLAEARQQVEVEILRGFVTEPEVGGYLSRLALMPKGVDPEILQCSLGLPLDEAQKLLEQLETLSFVKRFKAPPGAERLHGGRIFLHDEMYQLLTKPGVIRNLRLNEIQAAQGLITSYYDPQISQLEDQIAQLPPTERIELRERLQKLQVERLYYMLARDPWQGYAEYKRLSDQANRHRWVGFGMRLLDEFLRLYNKPERREQFETASIPYDQVIRESAQMWVERFHWWGQREREIRLARHILDQPEVYHIRPEADVAILGNVCALWARAQALLHGYEPNVVKEAQTMLDRLPALADCTPEQALARARLSTSIGYQFRLGGMLVPAAENYVHAKAAFRKLEGDPDELAMLLNNLALVYALQGRMALARPLAHEALRLNEEMGSDYSTGLTLVSLANIARTRGNYPKAVTYGEEALALFRELEDTRGTVMAHWGIACAMRRMAKQELEKGRKLEEARQMLEEARRSLESALSTAEEAGLGADIPRLQAELGRIYREAGHVISRLEGREEGLVYYRQGERHLRQALQAKGWGKIDQADTLEDLAEVLFVSGDEAGAREHLAQVEELIGPDHRIDPGEQAPPDELPHEPFAPLGKVEMLRGQMAFAQDQLESGLQHYVLAYAYLARFSPDAVEKETLLEYLYKRLRDLPIEQQRKLMESVRAWSNEYAAGIDVNPFVQAIEDLLGV